MTLVEYAPPEATQGLYVGARDRVADATAGLVERAFLAIPDFHDPDIDAYVAEVVPYVSAGQDASVALADANMALLLDATELGLDAADIASGLRPVPPEEVYRRPFGDVFGALADGVDFATARQRGATRAFNLAHDDVRMANLVGEQRAMDGHGVRYWRRVLSGAKTHCPFCYQAAGVRYRVRASGADRFSRGNFSYHTHCGCSGVPLPDDAPVYPDRLDSRGRTVMPPEGYNEWAAKTRGAPRKPRHYELGGVENFPGGKVVTPARPAWAKDIDAIGADLGDPAGWFPTTPTRWLPTNDHYATLGKITDAGKSLDDEIRRRLDDVGVGGQPPFTEAKLKGARAARTRAEKGYDKARDEAARRLGYANYDAAINDYLDRFSDQAWGDLLRADLARVSPDLAKALAKARAASDNVYELLRRRDEELTPWLRAYADEARKVLGEYRPMGGKAGATLIGYGPDDALALDALLNDAMRDLPSDWLAASNAKALLAEFKEARAWYRGGVNNLPGILNVGPNTPQSVLLHEMGHRMEDMLGHLKAAEWAFYHGRTGDEKAKLLSKLVPGSGYDKTEYARKDKFANPYVGKDYGAVPGSFYEVLTMGLEGVFYGRHDILTKDPDMASFILGLLALG